MKRKKIFQIVISLLLIITFHQGLCEKTFTLNFYQAKLGFVLEALSKKTGIKLITSSSLAEKPISAYLKDVTGDEAIDAILRANGLYREKMKNTDIYVVKELKEVPELKDETFFLQYAKAKDIGNILSPFLTKDGKIIIDVRTNSITIKDTPENLDEIRKIISQLDKNIPQISIEAVLVELTTDGLKDIGINWNIAGNFFGGAKDVPYPWHKSFGREIVNPRDVSGGAGGEGTTGASPQFILGTISFQTLTANLRFLENRGEANILASPRVTTLNDTPAKIKITKNIVRAVKTVYHPETGVPISKEPIYGEVGVSLIVTPHVNEEGYITLDVEPSVSSAEPSTFFTEAVDTHERSAKTMVRVKDGETVVIGGLLRIDKSKKSSKVPILGDLFPFLFKSHTKNLNKTDLIILITPHVVGEKEMNKLGKKEKEKIKEIYKDE